jgi:ABC-type glycerol-3-phosphate transport system substrate-binding protein
MTLARLRAGWMPCLALAAAVLTAAVGAGCARTPRKTEIVFWHSRPGASLVPLVRAFESQHPGVAVQLRSFAPREVGDSLDAALASGAVPDLCECPSTIMPRLVASAVLADWTAGVADLRDSLRGWEQCSRGETTYGLPWVLTPRVLFFDAAWLARAGTAQGAPQSWQDLAHDAAAIEHAERRATRPGAHGIGLAAPGSGGQFDDFMPLAWGAGGEILSADLDSSLFDSPENRAALAFWLRLRHSALSLGPDELEREFLAGRLALLFAHGALAGRIAAGHDFRVGGVPVPNAEHGRRAALAEGGVLVSFRGSRQKEAALRLARFLAAPASMVALTAGSRTPLPARIEADSVIAARGDSLERGLVSALEDVRFPPNHAAWDSMRIAIDDALAAAWRDSLAPPESAAARATAAADRRLVELLGRH